MRLISKLMNKSTNAPVDQRKQLIRETMQFLLQRDEKRFSRQLLAQLLDEGCNYPLALAKSRFYALMIPGLAETLNSIEADKLTKRFPDALSKMTHSQFNDAIRFYMSHMKHPEEQLARLVIDSLTEIKMEWQLDSALFTKNFKHFNQHLQSIVEQFSVGMPTGSLSALPLGQIRRRLYISLTTSLLKYVSERNTYQLKFGSVPEVIKAMQKDHTVFCRVMAFFKTQTPYFSHLACQTFWRTLQNMNCE